ncbi:TraG family conjugative transposon ATPase [Nibrella saemangeumensis]|uniref:TraG family conjugative transposon ATPase n=1 Tax=Nibrella saemangeumensis TaxID=1084526 RepID=A0ABP8NCK6_9BACT
MQVKTRDIKDLFPIGAVQDDLIFSKWGDITVSFEVILPEIYTLNVQWDGEGDSRVEMGEYRELVEAWSKAIGVLPPHTIVHKQDWFVEEKYQPKVTVNAFLDKTSERHFNERPYLNHRCFLFLTKTHPERRSVSAEAITLARTRLVSKEVADAKKLDDFLNAVEQCKAILESTRLLRLQRLTTNDIVSTAISQGLLERYYSLSLQEEVVTLADIERDDCLRIGGKFAKFYTISDVDDMPDWVLTHNRVDAYSSENSTVSVCFAAPVGLMLPCNHIYNQYVFKDDKHVSTPELEQRATQMRSLASFGKANEVNAMLINEYLTEASQYGWNPIHAHFNVQVWTEEKSKLPVLRNLVSSAIAKMGARPRENSLDAMALFWAGIPGNAADLPKEDRYWTFTPQAVCLFNQETNDETSLATSGIKLTERLSGKPINVDFSDEPMKKGWITNRNKFIIGPSGSGKSFFTNHAVRSYHAQDSHIVIVDVGHSYSSLCEMLGGKYLTYDPANPISFNPFVIEGRAQPDIEKKEALKTLLQTLWKRPEQQQTRTEDTALAAAIDGYYQYLAHHEDIFPGFDSFYEYLQNGFVRYLDEHKVREKHFDLENFMYVLRSFYKGGEYDYLLNSRTNLDLLHDRLVIFELDNIKDHPILFPVVTIIIMDVFIAKMRKLMGIRKIILIEEAWKAIMKDEMAEYIRYLYKTVRKFFGEAWIVTQEVDDIIGNKIVKDSIINNADTKILLDQRKYQNKFGIVQELLALTKKEKDLCLSLNRDNDPGRLYKEVFVSWGGQHSKVYGVEVSREEYYAFTTEQREKLNVQQKVQQQRDAGADINYELAIKEIVAEERGL